MSAGKHVSTGFIILSLVLSFVQCGSYESKIVGKWAAVENNCDDKGNCKNKDDVTGVFEYTGDGKLIIDEKLKGSYTVKKNIVEIKFQGSDLEWSGEIYYIKGNEMLAKYKAKLASARKSEDKKDKEDREKEDKGKDETALGETDIIKYNRVKSR